MDMYTTLLQQGYTLPDIDGMDILFYFRLMRHAGERTERDHSAELDQLGL